MWTNSRIVMRPRRSERATTNFLAVPRNGGRAALAGGRASIMLASANALAATVDTPKAGVILGLGTRKRPTMAGAGPLYGYPAFPSLECIGQRGGKNCGPARRPRASSRKSERNYSASAGPDLTASKLRALLITNR